jgi:FKBP-type peptidyl-prolyl cis-trans isomerase 2
MKLMRFGLLPVLLLAALIGCMPSKVAVKKVVQVSYKLTLADGSVFDESAKDKPLEFMVGVGRMIPAFETAIMGLKVGDKKTFAIKAADAYGEYDKAKLVEVPKEQFPKDTPLTVGMHFSVQTSQGTLPVSIAAVGDKTVTVDTNNPLAGKDLTFAVEIVKIRDATKEEVAAMQTAAQATPK